MPAANRPARDALLDSWGRRNRKHAARQCAECGGSGKRLGIYADLECPDCGGEGQWTDDPEEGDTGKSLEQVIAEHPELQAYRDELRARLWNLPTKLSDPLLNKRRAA